MNRLNKIPKKSKIKQEKGFKISRMKEKIKATDPHKHDHYHEIIFLTKGTGFHTIDLNSLKVQPPQLFLVKAGQVHYWEFTAIPKGFVVEYTFARAGLLTINGVKLPYTEALETKPEVAFQMLDNGEVTTVGELFLRASEVNKVSRVLHENGITITALHNHMLNTQPRMFWMHWVAKGEPGRLAKGIRAALGQLNLQKDVLPVK